MDQSLNTNDVKLEVFNSPILKEIAEEVTLEEIMELKSGVGEFFNLVQKMKAVVTMFGGRGIAAPQMGVSKRVFVAILQDGKDPKVFINPKISDLNVNLVTSYEGCLSMPGLFGYVSRPSEVTVSYVNGQALAQTVIFNGMESTIVCHEYDHLNGILFPSRGFNHFARRSLKKQHKLVVPTLGPIDYPIDNGGVVVSDESE